MISVEGEVDFPADVLLLKWQVLVVRQASGDGLGTAATVRAGLGEHRHVAGRRGYSS